MRTLSPRLNPFFSSGAGPPFIASWIYTIDTGRDDQFRRHNVQADKYTANLLPPVIVLGVLSLGLAAFPQLLHVLTIQNVLDL